MPWQKNDWMAAILITAILAIAGAIAFWILWGSTHININIPFN